MFFVPLECLGLQVRGPLLKCLALQRGTVDVHVGNLRRKLRDAGCGGIIQTVRGVGFCLEQNRPEA